MKLKGSSLFWTFIWCWFMGVTAISIGFGALFPSMNLIAKPFVCPGGKMDLDRQVYNPYPGNTITTLTWYCVDETSGTKTELGIFPMSLYAGTIYGLVFFGLVYVGMLIKANGWQKVGSSISRFNRESISSNTPERNSANILHKPQASENTLARMRELKELRAANLISEAEYKEKRAQILKDL